MESPEKSNNRDSKLENRDFELQFNAAAHDFLERSGTELDDSKFSKAMQQLYTRVAGSLDLDGSGDLNQREISLGLTKPNASADEALFCLMVAPRFEIFSLAKEITDSKYKPSKDTPVAAIQELNENIRKNRIRPEHHFLDCNKDGRIEHQEIASRLQDKQLTVEESQYLLTQESKVIGSTKNFRASCFALPSIELEDLKKITDLPESIRYGLQYFAEFCLKSHLERSRYLNQPLFTQEDSVQPWSVLQQGRHNCYLQAAIASIAGINPQKIREMITPANDSGYLVRFPGASDEPIKVNPLSNAEQLYSSGASKYGAWTGILEKAYGIYRSKHNNHSFSKSEISNAHNTFGADPSFPNRGRTTLQESTDWGFCDDALKLLNDSKKISLFYLREGHEKEIAKVLEDAMTKRLPMTAETGEPTYPRFGFKAGENKSKLADDHIFSVLNYDATNKVVTVRDPRGEETGANIKNELLEPAKNGILKLRLSTFVKYFTCIFRADE